MEQGEAFREFYDRALPVVYGYFFRRCGGRRDIAEELTQETFVSAVRSLTQGPRVNAPLPWVMSIARRRLVDFYRSENRRRTAGQQLSDGSLPQRSITTVAEVRLLTALDQVPEMQRLALVLRYVDDLSVREVASLIDKSERATESLLTRGRRSLLEAYQEVDDG
jgi:RNA polymerase sigma-70 factor, ECF subfamily